MKNCIECNDRLKCDYYMHDYVGCSDLYRQKKYCEKEKELVEVIHAKWIGKPLGGYSTVRCSSCNTSFKENNGRWKYCPECGSKMDLK